MTTRDDEINKRLEQKGLAPGVPVEPESKKLEVDWEALKSASAVADKAEPDEVMSDYRWTKTDHIRVLFDGLEKEVSRSVKQAWEKLMTANREIASGRGRIAKLTSVRDELQKELEALRKRDLEAFRGSPEDLRKELAEAKRELAHWKSCVDGHAANAHSADLHANQIKRKNRELEAELAALRTAALTLNMDERKCLAGCQRPADYCAQCAEKNAASQLGQKIENALVLSVTSHQYLRRIETAALKASAMSGGEFQRIAYENLAFAAGIAAADLAECESRASLDATKRELDAAVGHAKRVIDERSKLRDVARAAHKAIGKWAHGGAKAADSIQEIRHQLSLVDDLIREGALPHEIGDLR